MEIMPFLNILILIYFIIYLIKYWKSKPKVSAILFMILLARLIGIFIYFYIINVKPTNELVNLRYMFDDLTYIALLVFMFYTKKKYMTS